MTFITGDVLDWAAHYDGPPFHALLCDPPYHLYNPETQRPAGEWDGTRKDPFQRTKGGGFMGKAWDGGDIAFRPETWAALAEHLHPGAFGMAFASSRGWHRMACAIEDAGLVFHPSVFLLGWTFGSGFPKSTRIDTQIDRAAGAEEQRQPEREWTGGQRSGGIMGGNNGTQSRTITAPATPLAQTWATHRYGLQTLKPSLEPVIVFQRPYAGRPVDSITRTGAGAINVDGGRIPTDEAGGRPLRSKDADLPSNGVYGEGLNGSHSMGITTQGRWPAHLALLHTPDCTPDACADGCAVKALGEQSGESVSNAAPRGGTSPNPMSWYEGRADGDVAAGVTDTGTAARFFFNADYLPERMAGEPPFRYTAKADRWEREAGLSGPQEQSRTTYNKSVRDANGGDSGYPRCNAHPTVKPLALIHWLATLLLPPDAYAPRRLLVPFAGSGSEVIGATLAGWEDVVGIEQDAGYVAIAEQRLAFWSRFVGADGWEATQQRARAWADAEAAREVLEAGGQLTLPMF